MMKNRIMFLNISLIQRRLIAFNKSVTLSKGKILILANYPLKGIIGVLSTGIKNTPQPPSRGELLRIKCESDLINYLFVFTGGKKL